MIGISSEPVDRLKSKMVKEHGATYWIGSDPQNTTFGAFVSGEDAVGIPQFYLVDASGTVVGMDVPTEKLLEKLLKATFTLELNKTLHQKLARARLAYERGSYAIAFETAGKLLRDKDEAVVADAGFLRERISKYAAYRRKVLEADLKRAGPAESYGNLLLMKHELAGVDPQLESWVQGELARLKKTDEIKAKAEKKAWRLFEKTLRREIRGFASDYERGRVKVLYAELREKHRRTAAAELAKQRLEKLQERR